MRTTQRWRASLVRWSTLCLLALVVLAGCGQQNETGGQSAAQSPAAQAPAETGAANTRATVEAETTGVPAGTEETQATSAAGTTDTAATPAVGTAETPAASPAAETTGTSSATEGTTATAGAGAAVPEGSFQNPVLRQDFPDPHVIKVGDTYYAYATNGTGRNVQTARSTDLVKWEVLPDALPVLPAWVKPGFTWAPEVIQVGETFLLYYTARDKASDKQCVGVAVSDKPEGRFKDTRDSALVCQTAEGGTIDASPFLDGDKLYLLYKNDGN